MTIEEFEKEIGYTFEDKELIRISLTHSSYSNERKLNYSNERPEFLGDSVLGFITAEYLYKTRKGRQEGELTVLRSRLVCESSLHGFAKQIKLGEALFLGKGEELSGGRTRPSVLADAFEAVVAAIYLDGGIEPAERFVLRFISKAASAPKAVDYKSRLQEEIQKEKGRELKYVSLGEEGPDHSKIFVFAVELNGEQIGKGKGATKKDAQQLAAKNALKSLAK